jgi:hypothetical protein
VPDVIRQKAGDRPVAPTGKGEDLVFISTAGLISPAREIRVELVYQLTGAKIVREER